MSTSFSILLARQPILNRNLKIVGYELLCRPAADDNIHWQQTEGDAATSEVLIAAFNEIGIHEVTNGLPAYINFTEYWLHHPPLLSTRLVVAEVLETIAANAANLQAIRNLAQKGYKIALDDYIGNPDQDAFFPYLNIVKVDIRQLAKLTDLAAIIQRQKKFALTWLAEKVETLEEFEYCKSVGCTLFQGFFFSRPTNVYGKRLPDSQHAVLQLLQLLNNQDATFEDIANVVKTDPQLSYKVLKVVNSAAYGMPRAVNSIQQALMLLGLERLRAWSNVMALGRLNQKSDALREHVIVRAHLCQFLAQAWGGLDKDMAFTLGLLSLLPSFLDTSFEMICQELNLSDTMTAALLHHQGDYGTLLLTAMAMEQAQWDQIDWPLLVQRGIKPALLKPLYLDALQKTKVLFEQLLHTSSAHEEPHNNADK